MLIENNYIDFTDIDSPLKKYVEDIYILNEVSQISMGMNFYIRKNKYELEDSIFPSIGAKAGEFLSVERTQEYYFNREDDDLFVIYLAVDPQIDAYSRKVLPLLEVTGTLGGIFEIFEICAGLFIGFISKYMLRMSLYKDILKADEKLHNLTEKLEGLSLNKNPEKAEE